MARIKNRVWGGMFALVVLVFVQGCSESRLSDAEHLDRGKQYFFDGNYKASVVELKNVLQQNHNNAEARWLLAHNYIVLGDGASAEKELLSTQKLGVSPSELALDMAKAIYLQRDFRRLIDQVNEAALPDSATAKSTLLAYVARAHLELLALDDAERVFNEAYQVQGENPYVLIGLARLALAKKNEAAAVNKVAEALELAGDNSEIWLAKGEIESGLKNFAEAEKAFQKAIDLEGGDVLTHTSMRAQMGMVRSKLALKKIPEAKEHLEVLEKVNSKHFFVVYFRGVIAYEEGDYPTALSDFQAIEKRYSDFRPNILMLGTTHFALKNYQQAEIYLSRFLKLEPDFIPARIALASLQLNNYHPQKALELLGETSDSGNSPEILSLMADASVQMGEVGQGSAFIRKALTQAPDAQRLKIKLASSELLLGNPKRAISVIQENFDDTDKPFPAAMVEIDSYLKLQDISNAIANTNALITRFPDDPRGYNLRGSIRLLEGNVDEAKQDFELAIDKKPGFAAAWLNLGVVAEQQNDIENAKQYYQKAVEIDDSMLQAMLSLAKIAEAEGRGEDRIRWLERARASNPRSILPRVLLAKYYIAVNKNAEAVRISNELDEISENHPESLKLKGAILAGQGDFAQSHELYLKLVQVAPSAENLLRLAKSEVRLQDHAAARKTLVKVLKQKPDNVTALSMMASIEIRNEEYGAALSRAKKLQASAPESVAGFLMAGDVYSAQRQYKQAAKAYDAAAGLAPSGVLIGKKAWALHLNGEDSGAEQTLTAWLTDNPKDVVRSLMLASIKELRGDIEGAVASYQQVLQQDQRNYVAQNQMALILDKSGKLEEALVFAEKAHKNSNGQVAPIDTLGWLLVKSGAINRGLLLLKNAVDMAPDALNIQYHYAYALNEVGDSDKAKQILKTILKDGDEFSERQNAKTLLAAL